MLHKLLRCTKILPTKSTGCDGIGSSGGCGVGVVHGATRVVVWCLRCRGGGVVCQSVYILSIDQCTRYVKNPSTDFH